MDNSLLWLWLSLHFGEGTRLYRGLLDHFGSIERIYESDDIDALGCNILTDTQRSKLLDKNLSHAIEIRQWCIDNDISIITYADDLYPHSFTLLEDFPAVFYCLGNFPELEGEVAISIVGTRRMSVRGERMAFNLGYTLAKGGAYTVSGMALGIDATAQRGTLAAGGFTIAVLGSGINVIYPKANEDIYYKIAETGAIITEYPPNTPPNARNFPVRNRLISALGLGLVVVEGDENSGSMITARRAKKQKKDIFAVPGPGGEFLSAGPNKLIREGAIVVESAVDILEQYLDVYSCTLDLSAAKVLPKRKEYYKIASKYDDNRISSGENTFDPNHKRKKLGLFTRKKESSEEKNKVTVDFSLMTEDEKVVYDAMEEGKMITADHLTDLGYDVPALSVILLNLEINGFIDSNPGGFYVKKKISEE